MKNMSVAYSSTDLGRLSFSCDSLKSLTYGKSLLGVQKMPLQAKRRLAEVWSCGFGLVVLGLWRDGAVAVDFAVGYGVGFLAAGVGGVAFNAVDGAVFDLFKDAHMVGDAVMTFFIGLTTYAVEHIVPHRLIFRKEQFVELLLLLVCKAVVDRHFLGGLVVDLYDKVGSFHISFVTVTTIC